MILSNYNLGPIEHVGGPHHRAEVSHMPLWFSYQPIPLKPYIIATWVAIGTN